MMLDDRKESGPHGKEIEMKRKSLLRLLKPNDVLMFEDDGKRSYLFVQKIDGDSVCGEYLCDSGEREKKSISIDEIASRDPYVAYLQKILVPQ